MKKLILSDYCESKGYYKYAVRLRKSRFLGHCTYPEYNYKCNIWYDISLYYGNGWPGGFGYPAELRQVGQGFGKIFYNFFNSEAGLDLINYESANGDYYEEKGYYT